jgi:hypothetical protein
MHFFICTPIWTKFYSCKKWVLQVTCTSSTECKTVITAVLTVMSGMDPHMISGNIGFGLRWFGWVVKVDFY